jgi:hypothetical protein
MYAYFHLKDSHSKTIGIANVELESNHKRKLLIFLNFDNEGDKMTQHSFELWDHFDDKGLKWHELILYFEGWS